MTKMATRGRRVGPAVREHSGPGWRGREDPDVVGEQRTQAGFAGARAGRRGSSTRLSARAPSAWGAVRDALASLHNLDALLRSTSVLYRTIRDLLPELRDERRGAARQSSSGRRPAGTRRPSQVGDVRRRSRRGAWSSCSTRRPWPRTSATISPSARAHAGRRARGGGRPARPLERAAEPVPTDVSLQPRGARDRCASSGAASGREVAVHMDDGDARRQRARRPLRARAAAHAAGGAVRDGERRGGRRPCARVHGRRGPSSRVEPASPADDAPSSERAPRPSRRCRPRSGASRRVAAQIGATLELEPRTRRRSRLARRTPVDSGPARRPNVGRP